MNDTTQQAFPDPMLPVTQNDLEKAGFPAHAPMVPGLAVFFNDALFQRCTTLARIMSRADGVMPRHLIGKPESCFAIISRAITWNLDPYACAMSTYQTPGGSIGFEGKLIQAILENSGRLDGNVEFDHQGDWSKVKGKFKIIEGQKGGKYPSPTWTREDASGCKVVVSAQVKGEKKRRTLVFDLETAYPLNSPLWATAPERQVCYTAVRAFANQSMPGILMGLSFDYDQESPFASPMQNITPPRPQKGGGEFDRQETTDLHKSEPPKAANGKAEPKSAEPAKAEPQVQESVAAKDETKAEVTKHAEPADDSDEMMNALREAAATTQVESGPVESNTATNTADLAAEMEQWYRDNVAEVEKTTALQDLFDLRDKVLEQVDDAKSAEFKKLVGARLGAILKSDLATCKSVKEVTNLRSKHSALLSTEQANWFNAQADNRQREILAGTSKAKKP